MPFTDEGAEAQIFGMGTGKEASTPTRGVRRGCTADEFEPEQPKPRTPLAISVALPPDSPELLVVTMSVRATPSPSLAAVAALAPCLVPTTRTRRRMPSMARRTGERPGRQAAMRTDRRRGSVIRGIRGIPKMPHDLWKSHCLPPETTGMGVSWAVGKGSSGA